MAAPSAAVESDVLVGCARTGSGSRRGGDRHAPASLIALALALILPIFLASEAESAEAGRVEARIERGFARLVFSFDERPRHAVTAQAGVLVIRFERALDVYPEDLRRALAPLVANIRQDSDGRGLRFALNRRVRVNATEAGSRLYVDLMPEPWAGPPPPLPPEVVAELERAAQEAERQRREEADRARRRANVGPVEVVLSEAATFTRLEFRWPEPVEVTLQRADREARLVFARLGRIELGPIRARTPRFVEDLRAGEEDARSVVTLAVDPLRDLRTFTEGSTVFLDILGPERGRAIELRSGGVAPDSDPAPEGGAQALTLVGAGDQAAPPEPSTPAPDPISEALAPAAAPAAPMPAPPSPSAQRPSRPGEARVEAKANGAAGEIRLLFPSETAAAAYLRGQLLTLVFDTSATVDPESIAAELPRLVRSAHRERLPGPVEIVRVELREAINIAAESDGQLWTVRLADAPSSVRALEPKARAIADGRSILVLEAPRATRVVEVSDPIVGDRVAVATMHGPNSAVVKPQHFVDFELLRTAQGAAVRPTVDDLAVRLDAGGILIEREPGLSLSTGMGARPGFRSPIAPPESRTGFVDFEGWKLDALDRFGATRDRLVARAAAASDPSARTGARLDLARFFLAHGLGHEASAVLTYVGLEDPAAARDLSYRILRGAANVLAHRAEEAERDLLAADLDENPDVALWRGLAASQRRDWARARRFIDRARPVLEQYPRALQARVLRLAAEAAIELGDIGPTDGVLDEALSLDPSPAGQSEIALLRGRIAETTGAADAALAHYAVAARASDPEVVAEAELRRIALAARLERMAREAAIAGLNSLAMSWRGDHVELDAYRLLAGMHVARADYRAAFAASAAAARAAPSSEAVRTLQDEMREVFADLYTSGRADGMPALEALALFYDFRELVPPGRRGDEMVRALSERLIEVDLLDQAAQLLAHQVDNRLQGAARAEVATRLAFVHLMNREPDRALAVLRRTRSLMLAGEIERRRLLLEARALAALGRADLAVDLLGGDSGPETKRLRADLLWEGRRWAEAAAAGEDILGDVWRRSVPLSESARGDVLRMAVAYALAGDQAGIDRARARFSGLMADTPEAASFRLLTNRIETQGTEFRALARQIAAADTFERFLKEYRERFRGRPEPRTPPSPQAGATGTEAGRG